jgi:hypothetical protein
MSTRLERYQRTVENLVAQIAGKTDGSAALHICRLPLFPNNWNLAAPNMMFDQNPASRRPDPS